MLGGQVAGRGLLWVYGAEHLEAYTINTRMLTVVTGLKFICSRVVLHRFCR
jgi:hypothetical protein